MKMCLMQDLVLMKKCTILQEKFWINLELLTVFHTYEK
jgi:hypothetical protein